MLGSILRERDKEALTLGEQVLAERRHKQADQLLAAHSNHLSAKMIQSGRFNIGDFVSETDEEREQRQYGGLSPEVPRPLDSRHSPPLFPTLPCLPALSPPAHSSHRVA